MTDISVHVVVTGLVQGVGFRPFIYRIATRFQLTGWVINTNENVKIQLNGSKQNIESFLLALREESPVAAVLDTLSIIDIETTTAVNFSIQGSHDISAEITEISPDIAVCDECLEDIHETGKRMDYSFVNCTNCGPRFTILQDLPYDRPRTTMKSFEMCPECRSEYENVSDRRFHAQPIACNHCGPKYELYIGQNHISQDIADVIHELSFQIDNGGIVLMKGLGGMHLACDAFNEISITKLRELKNREGKPFAVMFRDLHTLKHYAEVSPEEEQALTSWRRPIVLLEKKKDSAQKPLAAGLNACLSLLGVMLPYMPLHYQLFQSLKTPAMVLTSGNFSKEPILVDNDKAKAQFSQKVDAIVLHNREIHNRTDDSVVRVMGGKERVFRRSRSFAPAPVRTALNTEGIIAFGAELSNCFCVGKGKKAFMSQHIGDLQDLETALFYEETITLFKQLFRVKTSMVSVDMHPSYISTQCGIQMRDLPITLVQHHHAHIASCMAEHKLDETVIGVAFDGTGYGTDGNSWGSEFFICDLLDFQRISHFDYIPLPGG
ncbi:MAG: carbamoyltransferase HypF, partial [Bacteroidota bacterium]